MPMTSRAASAMNRLIWASSSVASLSPDSRLMPAAPRNAFCTLILRKTPSPRGPTTESASQRTKPPGHHHRDAGETGELGGDPESVRDDRQLDPPAAGLEMTRDRERRGARIERDALAVHHHSGGQPPDPVLRVTLQALAHLEGALGETSDDADRPAVRPRQPTLGLEHGQVLADRHARDAETLREVGNPCASVLLDESDDVLLAFAREEVSTPIGMLHPDDRSSER